MLTAWIVTCLPERGARIGERYMLDGGRVVEIVRERDSWAPAAMRPVKGEDL